MMTELPRPSSQALASLSQIPEDEEGKKNAFRQAEQVICLSAHFVFLHKSRISLFLLPLASEQFLIIRKTVFSAMNHQTVNKESSQQRSEAQTLDAWAQKMFSCC